MTEDPQDAGGPAAALAAVHHGLKAPTGRIEGIYLDVGNELSVCADLLQRMNSDFENLPQELNGPVLEQARQKLAAVARSISELLEEMLNSHQNLKSLAASLAAASAPIADLRWAVKTAVMVAINAKLGVAGLDVDRDDFTAFSDEVNDLARAMAANVSELNQTHEVMVEFVGKALAAWSRYLKEQREPLAAMVRDLSAALDAVAAQCQASVASTAETSRLSQRIVERIASTVLALQSGDSLRQRLEHVTAALENFQGEVLAQEILPPFLELERRQLAGARGDLAQEIRSARTAVAQLGMESQNVLDQAQAIYAGDKGNDSAIEALRQIVGRAISDLRQSEAEHKRLDKVAHEVSVTVGKLLEEIEMVESVEHEMRIASFNATIKSSKLDHRGRALGVVAQQMGELTKEIGVIARKTITNLKLAAQNSSDFARSTQLRDANALSVLEAEASSALAALESVTQKLKQALVGLARDVPAVKTKLNTVMSRLGESEAISAAVAEAEGLLQDLGASPDDASREHAFYAKLRQIYTMHAERMIHDEFVGASPPAQGENTDMAPDGADEDLMSVLF